MAGKLSKPKDDAAATETETGAGAMPSKTAVTKLTTTVRGLDQKLAKLRGEKGSAIKIASDDQNIDKAAFRAVMKEYAMEPEARTNYQRQCAFMRRYLDIELQGDLLKDLPALRRSGPGAS